MLLLRKIDCYGQFVLGILIIIMIPILFNGSFFIGLLLIGCWQIISAIFNTYSFLQTGFEKRILFYWAFFVTDLALFYFTYWIHIFTASVAAEVFFWITVGGAIALGAYYWRIYFKFIEFISLRNELAGLIKSKH